MPHLRLFWNIPVAGGCDACVVAGAAGASGAAGAGGTSASAASASDSGIPYNRDDQFFCMI